MEEIKNVVAFMNMKGGVSKSTLCANMGYTLANHFNKRVLVIDMDPQFNLTSLLIDTKTYKEEIYGISDISKIFDVTKPSAKEKEKKITAEAVIKCISKNLYIIPGSLDLISIHDGEESYYKLMNFISENNCRKEYDYILIDCPPTKGSYFTIAYYAADYYIIPVKPDYLSTIGIELFKTTIEEKNLNKLHVIDEIGIIFTMVNNEGNHHKEKMKEIKKDYEYTVFENELKHSYKIPENAEKRKMIYDFNESVLKKHKDDIINISEEFIKRMEEKKK